MRPNVTYIRQLMTSKNWSNGKLALQANLSRAMVGRVLSGKRGAGKAVISGLLQAFPGEPLNKLFFFGLSVTRW